MKLILITVLTASVIIPCYGKPGAEYGSGGAESRRGLIFLPDARISIAPAAVHGDMDYYTVSRFISLDVFRYGPLVSSFSTYENMDYGRYNDTPSLNSIYYSMEYINFRFETPSGNSSVFIDHRCMNFADIQSDESERLRWYGYGARWESRGMAIGEKDKSRGLDLFSSGDYLNFSASVRKAISTRYYPYSYTADFSLRFDYYISAGIIPYISGEGEFFFPWNNKWNRSAESGVRFAYMNTDIIPFVRYSYTADRSISESGNRNLISAGIRVETSLAEYENNSPGPDSRILKTITAPELHLRGSYSKYIDDSSRNFRSDILMAVDLLRLKKNILFLNSSLIHSSPQLGDDTGLYPRYIDYFQEAGISVPLESSILIEPYYRYTGYGEGNTVETGEFRYHTTGLRIRTRGMKPGYINTGLPVLINDSFSMLLNTETEVSAGWVPDNDNKDGWFIEAAVREDIFSFKSTVQYISLKAQVEQGIIPGRKKILSEITPECGIRFNRKLIFIIFYQYITRSSADSVYDISREYHLAGVRIDL